MILAGVLGLGLAAGTAWGGQPVETPNYNPAPPKQGYSYPECYCTDSEGRRVELGQRACLAIGSRRVLARCDMSANNPAWRYESEGCPGV